MLMRNSFLDPGIDRLWYHLALRIAFFIGFGACCLTISRAPEGLPSPRARRAMTGFVAAFCLIAAVSSTAYAVLGTKGKAAFVKVNDFFHFFHLRPARASHHYHHKFSTSL